MTAMVSAGFCGMCAWLVLRSQWSRRHKAASVVGLVLIALLVGASRVYLGLHWLSDVLGGYAAGAAWLALCIAALSVIAGGPAGARHD